MTDESLDSNTTAEKDDKSIDFRNHSYILFILAFDYNIYVVQVKCDHGLILYELTMLCYWFYCFFKNKSGT